MEQTAKETKSHIFLLVSLATVFIWSLVECFDFFTWVLEALPVIIGGGVVIAVYKKFKLTNLVYVLIWMHAIILLIGAHYTYARMPLFNWLAEVLELGRNHYDRFGHIFQGFVPAIIARELLLRTSPLKPSKWLFFIVVSICLGISAAYEVVEWLVAAGTGSAAVAFLATQGDEWDTQKDMALCLVGAVAALLTLGRVHDRGLKKFQ
jgi:putative membrane protein